MSSDVTPGSVVVGTGSLASEVGDATDVFSGAVPPGDTTLGTPAGGVAAGGVTPGEGFCEISPTGGGIEEDVVVDVTVGGVTLGDVGGPCVVVAATGV